MLCSTSVQSWIGGWNGGNEIQLHVKKAERQQVDESKIVITWLKLK